MASLQARHQPGCPGRHTSFEKAKDGCSCDPRYYVVVRHGAKAEKVPVGTNRNEARKALTAIQHKVNEGSYQAQRNIRFDEWADRWHSSLTTKGSTAKSYKPTLDYAKRAFGWKPVRRLELSDVLRFLDLLSKAGVGESTRAKHLRVLGTCLKDAVTYGYAGHNPARLLPKTQRPRPTKKEAAYFENDELVKLFKLLPEGLYRVLYETALKTGIREGELLALRWGDVDLTGATIRVRRNWSASGITSTKNRERRDVDVTSDVVELLGRWWGECGKPDNSALVFPGLGKASYLSASAILATLYRVMKDAGIERVGPTGEKRTFHSFRHTFARIALEGGRPIAWVSRHLGHSGVQVTDGVYGHWARDARKAEMALMEGTFVI